jgi:hypothetical protein
MTAQTVQTVLTKENRLILRMAIQILLLVSHVRTASYSSYLTGTPSWYYPKDSGYWSYVSDRSLVTRITINQDSSGAYLYGLVVNGLSSGTNIDSYPLNPCPNYSIGSTFK